MSRFKLLEKGNSYTFRSYFELPYETDEVLSEFGVSLVSKRLALPKVAVSSETVEQIKADLEDTLSIVELASETARREVLVAPVLTKIARLSHSRLRIEYPLNVDDHLRGKLDYLVEGNQHLLVIEAKNDDISRGFTQLAVELIALARREPDETILYGAVTIGNIWLFGWLDVDAQQVHRDIALYSVPGDLQNVMDILMGIVGGDGCSLLES